MPNQLDLMRVQLHGETAADWHSRNLVLWAVMVAPWILVEERAR